MAALADEFLTVSEFARAAGVAPDTIRYWERRGQVHALRTIGGTRFFTRDEVDRVLRARGVQL